jgi:predicted solute-binding protein
MGASGMADYGTLIVPDEAHLLPLTHALHAGWVTPPGPIQLVAPDALEAAAAQGALALAPPLVWAQRSITHGLVADIAVTSSVRGTAALAAARRPDELDDAEIDARDVSPTTEALARLLGARHFGADTWHVTRQPGPAAAARLLEGDRALAALVEAEAAQTAQQLVPPVEGDGDEDDGAAAAPPPAGGYVEDLARAWFVLTGSPWVSHVMMAERQTIEDRPAAVAAWVAALAESLRLGREREVAVVATAAARLDLPKGGLRRLFRARGYRLGAEERQALTRFLQLAARHAGLPAPPAVTPIEVTPA